MKFTFEWIAGAIAWLCVAGAIAIAFPHFKALYNRPEKLKPLPIESLKIDKDLSFFQQPVRDVRFERVSCWYQIHGRQGKSGVSQFPIECELFARLKMRLVPPPKKESRALAVDSIVSQPSL